MRQEFRRAQSSQHRLQSRDVEKRRLVSWSEGVDPHNNFHATMMKTTITIVVVLVRIAGKTRMMVATTTSLPEEPSRPPSFACRFWYPMDLRVSGKDLIQNHLTMAGASAWAYS